MTDKPSGKYSYGYQYRELEIAPQKGIILYILFCYISKFC